MSNVYSIIPISAIQLLQEGEIYKLYDTNSTVYEFFSLKFDFVPQVGIILDTTDSLLDIHNKLKLLNVDNITLEKYCIVQLNPELLGKTVRGYSNQWNKFIEYVALWGLKTQPCSDVQHWFVGCNQRNIMRNLTDFETYLTTSPFSRENNGDMLFIEYIQPESVLGVWTAKQFLDYYSYKY